MVTKLRQGDAENLLTEPARQFEPLRACERLLTAVSSMITAIPPQDGCFTKPKRVQPTTCLCDTGTDAARARAHQSITAG
ncbi:hypothetical protein VE26_02320 [Devosia chinhatensis]|uniref:Uncharacterized protein n=1 Tax=Devosia chinhatensis TaxID=429727 RepID=A0A0F5FJ84_9HYPH|nr:hypothetical protein VE26_02320 [Devosia chinhatensis]